MSFLELVRKRQSVRRYASTPVSREALGRCLEAARLAPSACNSQPWRFIVVDDSTLRSALGAVAFGGIYSMNRFADAAPVLVAVVRERSKFAAVLGGKLRNVHYSLIDVGIACEHFVLQAEEEGLGTCWLGWFNERAVKRILKLSPRDKVDVLLSVGYAESDRRREKQRKLPQAMVRYNLGSREGGA